MNPYSSSFVPFSPNPANLVKNSGSGNKNANSTPFVSTSSTQININNSLSVGRPLISNSIPNTAGNKSNTPKTPNNLSKIPENKNLAIDVSKPLPVDAPNISTTKTLQIAKKRSDADIYHDFVNQLDYFSDAYINNNIPSDEELLTFNNKILPLMTEYESCTGQLPFNENYMYAPHLFNIYLIKSGIKPEIYDCLADIINFALYHTHIFPIFPWRALYIALKKANRTFNIELYLTNIVEGGAERLAELSEFGIVDHRLTHAVTTIQRLIRYGNSTPLKENSSDAAHRKWINEFEDMHHKREDCWDTHYIHLQSFDMVPPCENVNIETAIVHWNRQLIPEYICALTTVKDDNLWCYELSDGINKVLSSYGAWIDYNGQNDKYQESYLDVADIIKEKKEFIYAKKRNYLLDDDALTKIPHLIRLYVEGTLLQWKNPKRDVLKFLSYSIKCSVLTATMRSASNECSARDLRSASNNINDDKVTSNDNVEIASCYLARLDGLPLHVIETVFTHLDNCLAHHGRKLINDFSKLNIEKLNNEEIRIWFNNLVVDNVRDIAVELNMDEKLLNRFLKHGKGDIVLYRDIMIKFLVNLKTKILNKQPLYDYKIWSEPITVSAVVL